MIKKCAAILCSTSGPGEWGTHLVCPVCGCDEVHPIGVSVNPCGQMMGEVLITHEGLCVNKSVNPEGRGVVIMLTFCCESNCMFSYTLRFHKGNTYIFPRGLGDLPVALSMHTIWRD